MLSWIYGEQEIILIRIQEFLVNQGSGSNDSCHPTIEEQSSGFDLSRSIVRELLTDGNILIQILNKDFKETIQLKEREPGLKDYQITGLVGI